MTLIRTLTPELENFAQEQLNESPEAIKNGLEMLYKFLNDHPYIIARRDPQCLIVFLRGSKYDIEKAKEKLEASYKVQSQIPAFFRDRDITLDPRYINIIKKG